MSGSAAAAAGRALSQALSRTGESTTQDYETVKRIIKKRPGLARAKIFERRTSDGNEVAELPIFRLSARRLGATWTEHLELFKLVYNAFPGAIECPSSGGLLPLHVACAKNIHPRIIVFILKKYPKAVFHKEPRGGFTPLCLYVSREDPHVAVVKALVKTDPSCAEFEYRMERNDWANRLDVGEDEPISPLYIALARSAKLDILEALIQTDPKSKTLVLELESRWDEMEGCIIPEKSRILANGVSKWIVELQLDTQWFSRQGLETFLSSLASLGVSKLNLLDIMISSNVFADSKVRDALTQLLRKSVNLTNIRVRKPFDSKRGPTNDDAFFSALAVGLEGHTKIESLGLSGVRGKTLAGLSTILSQCSTIDSLALNFVSFTSNGINNLIRGIQHCSGLDAVFICPCKMPSGGLNKLVQALADCCTVSRVTVELGPLDDLPAICQLTNIKYLCIETDEDERVCQYKSAGHVWNLLESSKNHLQGFEAHGFELQASRLSGMLKSNTTLRGINLRGCENPNVMGLAIVQALRESNATLIDVKVTGRSEQDACSMVLLHELNYYMAMNKMGRADILHEDTANVSDLVRMLVNLDSSSMERRDDEYSTAVLRYGILRESPSLWSQEYVKHTNDEDTLVGAVAGLSLKK